MVEFEHPVSSERTARRPQDVVLELPFLLAVALLMMNDVVFKYLYPGAISGKLSDFAGLYALGCLAVTLVPKRAGAVALLVLALAFGWWKSPWSQPVIDAVTAVGWGIGRTVDYTDLVAVSILPLCTLRTVRLRVPSPVAATGVKLLSLLLVTAAVAGTSYLPIRDEYTIRKREAAEAIDRQITEAAIIRVLGVNGLRRCSECSEDPRGATYRKQDLYFRYRFLESGDGVEFFVEGSPGSMFFGIGSSKDEIASLQRQIRNELGSKVGGLEFVVDLSRQRS